MNEFFELSRNRFKLILDRDFSPVQICQQCLKFVGLTGFDIYMMKVSPRRHHIWAKAEELGQNVHNKSDMVKLTRAYQTNGSWFSALQDSVMKRIHNGQNEQLH